MHFRLDHEVRPVLGVDIPVESREHRPEKKNAIEISETPFPELGLEVVQHLGEMELSLLVGQRGYQLVRSHLAAGPVQAGEDGDGALEVRLADVDQRELIVSKGARETIRLVEPALGPRLVVDLPLYTTARFEEPPQY